MEQVLGTSLPVFIGMTCAIMGFAAYSTGQALGNTWRPPWQVLVYCVMLGFVDRFLTFALFEGELLSLSGYIVDTLVLNAIGVFAFRLSRTRRMVAQYPWIYERSGLLRWREKQ